MKRLQLILSFRLTIARQEKINWRRIYVEVRITIKYYTAMVQLVVCSVGGMLIDIITEMAKSKNPSVTSDSVNEGSERLAVAEGFFDFAL